MALPVDYSQKISSLLRNAEKTKFTPNKFDGFCKAAKLQFKSGLIENARATYEKADTLFKSDSYLDKIPNILKLVKLSILIHPNKRPELLSRAQSDILKEKNWAEQQNGKAVLGNTYGSYFSKLADCFYRLKNTPCANPLDSGKADQYLKDAIEWAGSGYPRECLIAYTKIAKACVIGNKKDEFLALIPKIEDAFYEIIHYSNTGTSLSWRLKITEIACHIDQNCAKRLLASAKDFIEKNRADLSTHNSFVDLTNQYQTLEQKMQEI